MSHRLNARLIFVLVLILAGAAQQIAKEHRPSVLRPGLHMYAYVTSAGDGSSSLSTGSSVSVVDLIRLNTVATISVGPTPSGIRAHPTRDEIWGVSTDGGYVWIIDARSGQVRTRIPVGAAPFAVDFSPDGKRAFVAASTSGTVSAIDCATQKVIATARTGKHPWLARVTPDGTRVLVPNRDDSTLSVLDAGSPGVSRMRPSTSNIHPW